MSEMSRVTHEVYRDRVVPRIATMSSTYHVLRRSVPVRRKPDGGTLAGPPEGGDDVG